MFHVFHSEFHQTFQNRTLKTFSIVFHLILFFNAPGTLICRSSHPEVFLRKDVLKICSKFTGEHPCQSVISIKLQSNFIEIALWHGCSSVNLLRIFRAPFSRKTSEWLFLNLSQEISQITSLIVDVSNLS